MSYDSKSNDSRSSAVDRSFSSSAPAASESDAMQEGRKPFVEPTLRRETGLVDGTGTTVSGMNVN
jgi:hypothetical protein